MSVQPASFGLIHYTLRLPNAYTTIYACSTPSTYAFWQVNRYDFTFICSCLVHGPSPPTPSSPFTCKLLLILSLQTTQEKYLLSTLEINWHRVGAASIFWLTLSVKSLVSSSAVCGTQRRWSIILKSSLILFISIYYFSCRSCRSELRVLLVYQIRTRLFPWACSIKNFQQFSESIDTVNWYRANTLLPTLRHVNKCGKSDNNMIWGFLLMTYNWLVIAVTSPIWFTKLGLVCSPGLTAKNFDSTIFWVYWYRLILSKRTVANATSCE